jgi:hypothetical protein
VANDALRQSRADLLDIIERAWDRDDKSVTDARTFYKGEKPVLGQWMFVHILSILLVTLGGGASLFVLLTSDNPSERASALNTLQIVGFAGAVAFWLGSSRSSQLKDLRKE